jgi:hypothetical protein
MNNNEKLCERMRDFGKRLPNGGEFYTYWDEDAEVRAYKDKDDQSYVTLILNDMGKLTYINVTNTTIRVDFPIKGGFPTHARLNKVLDRMLDVYNKANSSTA